MTDAIPAATVVLFRDRPGAAPLLLMVERARALAFAGGAMVFPGGRVDPGDIALAATLDGGPDAAFRIAAIRETIEEVGLPLALDPLPDAAALERLRAALLAGTPIADALATADVRLDLAALHPFARWLPAYLTTRTFDTRFFLARAPDGTASIDKTENVRLTWTTAAAALETADAGRSAIIFPTRRNLERLAQFADFAAALADARRFPQPVITPETREHDGVPHLCIPEGLGYPVTTQPITDVMRG